MKKLFVFCTFLSILPCFAANWVQVDIKGKQFIDTSSIKKYDYLGTNVGHRHYYSCWVKSLNDNSDSYKKIENTLKKKVWYSMGKVIINCSKEELAYKSSVYYDLNGEVISGGNIEDADVSLEWHSIIPDSVGNTIYDYACGVER